MIVVKGHNTRLGTKYSNHGFTIIEMSMVLVIIGMITAATIATNSLIHASKIRSVIDEYNTYNSALRLFYNQYGYYPGDFPNAGTIWTSCDPTPSNCNGNGNGIIEWAIPNSTANNEAFRAWQQLGLASMIPGNYSGTSTSGSAVIGVNTPASKYTATGYSFIYYGNCGPPGCAGDCMTWGGYVSGDYTHGLIIPVADLYDIDVKIDDGLPRYGLVWAYGSAGTTTAYCFNSNTAYNLNIAAMCAGHLIFNPDNE